MSSKKPRYLPLYEQIKSKLIARIASGEWPTEAVLPSEWDLADEFGVSQGTVRKAVSELTALGWLYRQQGRGTFVAPGESEWGRAHLVSPGQFAELPDVPRPELLAVSRMTAPDDVAQALGGRRGMPLHHLRLLWRVRGEAVALDDVLLPVERFAELDARRVRLAGGGVYVLLERQYAVRVRATGWQFRAVRCGREEAVLLGVEPDEELLSVVRLGVTVDGEVVEWRQRLVRSRHWAWQFDLKR